MAYRVPVSAIPLLLDPPFVVILMWIAAGIGVRVLAWLRVPRNGVCALEWVLYAVLMGLGTLEMASFLLGAVGVLKPPAVWMMLGVMAVLAAPGCCTVARCAWLAARRWKPMQLTRWEWALATLMSVALCAAMLRAVAPCIDPDGLAYHLAAPKRWLQMESLGYLPGMIHTNSPMGVEMLFTLPLAVWSDTAAKLIHFALGVFACVAVGRLGYYLGGRTTAVAATGMFALGVPQYAAIELFSYAYVDLGLVFAVVCAVLAFMRWEASHERPWLVCSALCTGIAGSFKLTGLVLLVALGLLTVVRSSRGSRAQVALFVAVAMAPVVPWLVRAWLLTGDPVYPFLSGIFPTRDWSPAAEAAFCDVNRYYIWASSASLSLVARRVMRGVALAIVIVIGAALTWCTWNKRSHAVVVVGAFWAMASVISTGLYIRYALPLMGMVWVCLFALIAPVLNRWQAARVLVALMVALGTFCCLRGDQPKLVDALRVATGHMSRDAYLDRYIPLMPVARAANRVVPAGGKVLLQGGIGSYYFDEYGFSGGAYRQQCVHLDSWDVFRADVARSGIRFLVADTGPRLRFPGPPDYLPARNEAALYARLVRDCGEPLARAGTVGLYRIPRQLGAVSRLGKDGLRRRG